MTSFNLLCAITLLVSTLCSAQAIDPNSVPLSIREYWCQQQTAQCPLICLQLKGSQAGTIYNSCIASTLAWQCVCANGQTPNISEYSQTIPYFECTQTNDDCVANCGIGNNACASECRTANPCGAQDPKRYNITSTTTSATTNPTPVAHPVVQFTNSAGITTRTGVATAPTSPPVSLNGNSGNTDGGSGGAGAAVLVHLGRVYGTALLAIVAAAVFGSAL